MKKTIATLALTAMMAVSAFANGGIIISELAGSSTDKNPCTDVKVDSGILVTDLVGIIISEFTGIIISDFKGGTTVNCGIIISE